MTTAEILQQYETRAVPVCGWPEWKGVCGRSHRLSMDCAAIEPEYFFPVIQRKEVREGWCRAYGITSHEALCIWRDWVRAFVAKKTCLRIVEDNDGKFDIYEFAGYEFAELMPVVGNVKLETRYDTYDDALLAAPEATND